MNDFELKLLLWVQEVFQCAVLDFLMPLVTRLGDAGIFWITVAVVLLFIPKYRKIGITMGVALVIGLLVVNCGLKSLVARIRPYDLVEGITLLIRKPDDFSFPSGHTVSSFAAAFAIFRNNKKWGRTALVVSSLIAFSRLYLYVHFPTDILGGIALGIFNGWIAYKIV